jgi:hypothetical protein
MKQLTAVEWLESEFVKLESTTGVYGIMYDLIEVAKAMEKEQIIDAHNNGQRIYADITFLNESEQYYNETYKETI